jgi:hypothetical protein
MLTPFTHPTNKLTLKFIKKRKKRYNYFIKNLTRKTRTKDYVKGKEYNAPKKINKVYIQANQIYF